MKLYFDEGSKRPSLVLDVKNLLEEHYTKKKSLNFESLFFGGFLYLVALLFGCLFGRDGYFPAMNKTVCKRRYMDSGTAIGLLKKHLPTFHQILVV